jgi:hypothetical protein
VKHVCIRHHGNQLEAPSGSSIVARYPQQRIKEKRDKGDNHCGLWSPRRSRLDSLLGHTPSDMRITSVSMLLCVCVCVCACVKKSFGKAPITKYPRWDSRGGIGKQMWTWTVVTFPACTNISVLTEVWGMGVFDGDRENDI